MTGAAFENKSRSVHRALRDLVNTYLDSQNITSNTKQHADTISDNLSDDVAIAPDISIDGVDLDVTSRIRPHRLSENLESVQRAAAIRGVGIGAFVLWRGDRPIAQSYVITSLDHFSKLVRGDHLAPPP